MAKSFGEIKIPITLIGIIYINARIVRTNSSMVRVKGFILFSQKFAPNRLKIKNLNIMQNEMFFVILESSILKNKNLTNSAKILYACICFSSNNESGYCFRNNKELMQLANISEKQFYRNIKQLTEMNYITTLVENNEKHYIPLSNKIYKELEARRKAKEEELKTKKEEFEILDFDWLNDNE